MAEYDGSLKFDTSLDNSGFEAGSKELLELIDRIVNATDGFSAELKKAFSSSGPTIKAAAAAAKTAADTVTESVNSSGDAIADIKEKIASAKQEMEELKGKTIPVPEYTEAREKLEEYKKAFQETQDAMTAMLQPEKNYDEEAFGKLVETAKNYNTEIKNLQASIKEYEQSGMTEQLGEESARYKQLEEQVQAYEDVLLSLVEQREKLTELEQETTSSVERQAASWGGLRGVLSGLGIAIQNVGRSALTTANSFGKWSFNKLSAGIKDFQKHTKNTTNTTNALVKSLTSMQRLLITRIKRTFISAIFNSAKEALKSLVVFSDDFNAAMSNIKNSSTELSANLAVGIGNMVRAIEPLLTSFINSVSTAIQYVNALFAALGGSKTMIVAKKQTDDYAASLTAAGGAAKQAARQLAGFDEIMKLEGESAGGGAGSAIKDLFEEVDLGSITNPFEDIIDVFKRAWENQGEPTIRAIKNAWNSIKGAVDAVAKSFREVFTNGTGQETLELILKIIQNIAGIVGGLADSFRKAWEENDTGTKIIQHLWDILNDVLGMIERITASTKKWAENLDFGPLLNSFKNLTGKLEPLVDLITDGLAWAWENILLPFGKWVIEDALPASIDAVAAVIDLLRANIELAQPALGWLWDNFLQPVGKWISEAVVKQIDNFTATVQSLTTAIDGLRDVLNGDKSVVDWVNENFGGLVQHITELIEFVRDPVGYVAREAGEHIISELFGGTEDEFWSRRVGFGNNVVEPLEEDLQAPGKSAWTWGADLISNFVSGIQEKWRELKSTVTSVAQGIADRLGHSHPKIGPLADDYKWMPDMMELFAKGIKDEESTVLKTISNLAGAVSKAMEDNGDFSISSSGVSAAISGFSDRIADGVFALVDTLQAIADNVTFRVPNIAAGTVLPYRVAAAASAPSMTAYSVPGGFGSDQDYSGALQRIIQLMESGRVLVVDDTTAAELIYRLNNRAADRHGGSMVNVYGGSY